jgi:hypothetical protein
MYRGRPQCNHARANGHPEMIKDIRGVIRPYSLETSADPFELFQASHKAMPSSRKTVLCLKVLSHLEKIITGNQGG